MKKLILIILTCLAISSCVEDINVKIPLPDYLNIGPILETYKIPDFAKAKINGIYRVSDGNNQFGEYVVLKWIGDTLSVFCGKNISYMLLQGGHLDSIFFFQGYWRFTKDESIGTVNLIIKREEGGRELMIENKKPQTLIMSGGYGNGYGIANNFLTLTYEMPLKESPTPFSILAHRGGGRNSDRLPASENSVEMIKIAEHFGATGIEIDVRLTSDNIPVIFHDDRLSSRTVNGDFALGELKNYTYRDLYLLCPLKNGEKIPTLRQALDAVLETNLTLVWLDMKVRNLMDSVVAIQKEYKKKAGERKRDLKILIGIPDDGIKSDFLVIPEYKTTPSLCEISINDMEICSSEVWAPRWTLGTLNGDVIKVHSMDKLAFVWTLDDPDYVRTFVCEGYFDGILTNYPYSVAYEYYMKYSMK
jgi:glycerophosphoryl diester phosphodiesterase